MMYSDNVIITQSEEDVEKLLKEFSCKDVCELADYLCFERGIYLIDKSTSSEYTQVEAQNSPEFYDEALTLNDLM